MNIPTYFYEGDEQVGYTDYNFDKLHPPKICDILNGPNYSAIIRDIVFVGKNINHIDADVTHHTPSEKDKPLIHKKDKPCSGQS